MKCYHRQDTSPLLIQVLDVSESQSEAFKDIKVGDHRIEGNVVGVFEVEVYRYQMMKIVLKGLTS